MSRYDLAVFDFDGTLADSADWFFGSLNEVAGRFGFRTTTEDERQALRRLDNREIIRRLQVPLWKLPAIARHMRRRVAENIDSIRLFGGIPEALTALRANGTRLAIVSSNSEANVRRVLGSELAGRIAFYGCGASLFGKTSKLRSAIRHCNVHRERTIYVGDETRDIEAARAAGTASGAVLWGYAAPDVLLGLGPTIVFHRVDQLRDL
jgi:phosphoglycolate phosphatase